MPSLKGKFGSYEKFASSTLELLYTSNHLTNAQRFEANTLETGVLINQGEGKFRFSSLPRLAQISPSFGVALSDFDGDGLSDIVLAQNSYSPQKETGAMDGGLSLLLRGQTLTGNEKNGLHFDPVWPKLSGIVIPGDSKSLGMGDINRDGRPDLLFGINNEAPALLLNTLDKNTFLRIRLRGDKGNPHAIGAKVTVTSPHLPLQAAEVYAGSGYLSQSTSALFFGLGENPARGSITISVRWPDGRISDHPLTKGLSTDLLIDKP